MLQAGLGLEDQLIAFVRDNIAWAEPLVFALGFAESIVFVSLLVPSTLLFLAIGGAHSAAGGELWSMWLAGAAGAFLGDVLSYSLGRYFRGDIAGMWPLSRKPEWYVIARAFFSRWGALGIVASKFFGMLRPFIPVVAGAMGLKWPVFVLASAVSALLWAGVFLSPGYGIRWLVG